jgi:hypothetical protein
MKKALPLCTILVLGTLFCGAALARTPAPQAPTLDRLQEAIFAPAGTAAPDTIPAPESKALCSPFPDDICIYYQCECAHQCSVCGGISSFTCNSSTGVHSCKCKPC